jgi:hypothetical protein
MSHLPRYVCSISQRSIIIRECSPIRRDTEAVYPSRNRAFVFRKHRLSFGAYDLDSGVVVNRPLHNQFLRDYPQRRLQILNMASESNKFDYTSLKELLKETNADVLLPTDGEEYEKSIERWSEHCIKRAVSSTCFIPTSSFQASRIHLSYNGRLGRHTLTPL